MPEGHTIHRYARLHRELFAGQSLRVSSPQGRFAAGASQLDGRRLDGADAHGKHLFYRWARGLTLHVHLGLFGKFRSHRGVAPPPSDQTRLALASPEATLYLSGPTVCELISAPEEETLRDRLGPDPLADAGGGSTFVTSLERRRVPIGAALLDQKLIAGIGNVYRAELLFLVGVDPARPANGVSPDQAASLWKAARSQLIAGEKSGRIVTVRPSEAGVRRRADVPKGERLYVYGRDGEPCRRCGTEIVKATMAARSIWSCPSCQPA